MNVSAYFARHAQTLIGSLGRIAEQPIAALMTMAVIAIAIALPLCLHVFLQNASAATGNWNQVFDVSVYLNEHADAARAQAIAKQLRGREDVAAVRVITADEALAEFRNYSGFGKALDALANNPLPHTLIVKPALAASTPEGTAALKAAIASIADVETVQLDTEWVQRLHAILDILRQIVLLAGGLLGIGVVLIVGNTIRLDVQNRHTEIEVMKLVGGTDGFARRPFLYSGLWYGLGGGILALALVSAAASLLANPVAKLAALYASPFQLSGLPAREAAAVLAGAAALGWAGSWVAATRHIRAIEPS
jgi:cell division transport system permease protein